jgi:Sec-independent protein secretion pathway component TatC
MSLPLCVLYFLSIGLAYLFGKRPSKEQIAKDRAERALRKAQAKAERAAKMKTKGKE